MTRMHLDATPEGSPLPISLCGMLCRFGDTTGVQPLVTCKLCLDRIREAKVEILELMKPRFPRLVPKLEQDTDEPPGYVVTPERWERQGCKCGRCDVCVWYKPFQATAEGSDGGATGPHEPPSPDKPRWSHVEAALAWYKGELANDYALSSFHGQLVRSREAEGVMIRTASANDPALTRTAQDLAMMYLCLRDGHHRALTHNLNLVDWTTVLLSRVVGSWTLGKTRRGRRTPKVELVPASAVAECLGVTEIAVAGIVRSGLRALRVEMGARQLVAVWRADGELATEIAARRDELLRRRTA